MATKIFLSQPMHGKTIEEIKEKRKLLKAAGYIWYVKHYGFYPEKKDIEFISTIDDKDPVDKLTEEEKEKINPRIYRLGHALERLSEADMVIFDDEYQSANGCLVEMTTCVMYKIQFCHFEEYKNAIKDELLDDDNKLHKYRLDNFLSEE